VNSGFLDSTGGIRLFYRHVPVEDAKAAVALVHGFAEHSGRYEHVIQALNDAGVAVVAIDLRGHGNSEGRRGHINRFQDYLDDVNALVDFAHAEHPELPLFLVGHSMGGLIVASYVANDPEGLAGFALSSPLMGLSVKVPGWKRGMAHGLSKLVPTLSLPTGLDSRHLTHDAAIVAAYEKDAMIFSVASSRWYTEITEAQPRILERADQMDRPFLLMAAGDDRICDVNAARDFFQRFGGADKSETIYEGFYHEIFNEIDRDEPITELVAWITRQ